MNVKKIILEEIKTLNEVGEGVAQPYEYEKVIDDPQSIEYEFTTEDDDLYTMWFMKMDDIWGTGFEAGRMDDYAVLDKGRLFRVMATVTKIIKEFAEEYDPSHIKFEAAKKRGERQRRLPLYRAFIDKHLPPEYNVEIEGDIVNIKKI